MNDEGTERERDRPPPSALAAQIFAGSGEMASLIRTADWSKTSLGPIEEWPQSLRTAVSICLGSRHPIVLWWGPQRYMFYNDGYRPMLGERKHPQFLGRPGHECWAEIWHIIGPMMEQVIATGEATWSEDMFLLMLRSGYLEETYFTFSYSPIRDEVGRSSGIFNACAETTPRVLADRRLKTLRQMNVEARTVQQAAQLCAEILGRNPRDVPFALLYLLDDQGKQFQLAAQAGLAPATAASPMLVRNSDDEVLEGAWPLTRVASRGSQIIDRIDRRFDCLPTEPWDAPPQQAMLLQIPRPGADRPAGVLVLGISPRRAFDDDYRGFFELVAAHVATEVSNARAYQEQLDRAEKLTELDRVKTAFFNNVSHELRTPLTLILGPVEDALRDPGKALRAESLEAVHRNALRLLRLVNSVLDFARVEANRVQSRFEPTDLSVLTGGLAGSFQSLLESAGLKLRVDCPALPEAVYVDRPQWEKIVLNLISNAFKFTFAGTVSVRLRAVDGSVELSVEDTGVGIPAHELPNMFERFHRVEGARGRSYEGTGIGLALVQELVKQHAGSIRVESTVDVGSAFFVRIPFGRDHLPKERVSESGDAVAPAGVGPRLEAEHWVADSRARSAQAAGSTETGPAAERSLGLSQGPLASASRVLVADDNADMRQYLVRLLSSRWTVEAVADGQAALEAVLARTPDLILSDVMMPRLDGVGLLAALRANPATSTIPVVLLSARAGEEAVVGALETGADDYLIKPFSALELLSRVGTHLEMARLRRRATEAAVVLAETRAELLQDLDRKNQELESFSYSVSHDLRAPLRSIDGFSQALIEDYGDQLDAQGHDYLRRVRVAAQRMGQLIDDLLALSRVERTELSRETVDLSLLARRIRESSMRSEPERRVAFTIQDGVVAPEADQRLVMILLENLLGNAWKFTSKTSDAQIELGAFQQEGQTVFFVRDNGAGFDQTFATRLFAPFQRLHSLDEFPGTGIGLATVRRIVDRHAGRIWAEGKIGGGATMYWTLPIPTRRSQGA